MGKNFSTNDASGKRKKSDFYETPYSMTHQFLDVENFDFSLDFLEPACGNNAIVDVLKKYTPNVTFYDKETDFLKEEKMYSYIVTNPPFSLAKEFILKAKEVAENKFAFLLPLSYLHGKTRYDLIYTKREFPLAKVYVFTRYPMLGEPLRSDGKYNTGMMVYAWYVWDRKHEGAPEIHWLDNNSYVASKNDDIQHLKQGDPASF